MKKSLIIYCATALLSSSPSWAEKPPEIEIGGMRQVKAVVEKNEEGYRCSLSFIPVSCFDDGTNDKVNQRKSRQYVARALALSAGIKDQGKLAIKHLVLVENLPVKEGRASYVYSASAVSVISASSPAHEDVPEAARTRASETDQAAEDNIDQVIDQVIEIHGGETLLGRLGDYRETLLALEKEFFSSIEGLDSERLDDAVADLEDRVITAYEKFSTKVRSEDLLLSLEKEQMINTVKHSQGMLIKRMSETYKALSEKLPCTP